MVGVPGTGFEEAEANGFLLLAAPDLARVTVALTRHLEKIARVYVSEPGCLAVTERKIEEARAVLKAAGVDPDGGA